jgi:hypothetical protein
MTCHDQWPDSEERREAADGEAHLYEQLAAVCKLSTTDRRDDRILDLVYKLHIGYDILHLPIPKRAHRAMAAQQGNRARGGRSLLRIKHVWLDLFKSLNRRPMNKEIEKRIVRTLAPGEKSLSPRHIRRLIRQLSAAGDIPALRRGSPGKVTD